MKTMYIDCGMGAAGDMLTAALLELLPETEREDFVNGFNSLGIPGVMMEAEPSEKCGVRGTHVRITVDGIEEGAESEELHGHHHDHEDGSHHAHHKHRGMAGVEHIVRDHIGCPDSIKEDVLSVYRIIADAESRAHDMPVSHIHFHEVGTMDAIADVTAVCMLMDAIAPDSVIASHVNTGSGTVKCAHGILPVPAPATRYILEGLPWYQGEIQNELCTPTGAALIRYFADDFGEMPEMETEAQGHGMGNKNFDVANCVTITVGCCRVKI